MGRTASKQNRQVKADLTAKGFICEIINTGGGYNIIINFEVVKTFKTRSSCNKYLKKLNNEKSE